VKQTSKKVALKRVLNLLKKVPMLDGHNDLPMVIRDDAVAKGDVLKFGLDRRHNDGDTDIPRLRLGKVGAQVWAAFVPSESDHAACRTLEQIDIVLQISESYPDTFLPVKKASDIAKAKRLGKIASLLAVEGGVGLENSLAPLRVWYAAGVRLMTLCHNGTLDWIDSATDERRHGGLTAFGCEVVRELNRLGIIVDCAHVSSDAMHHVLNTSTAPIVFSHSNARTLCNHSRNVPDDVLDRICKNDGLVMASFIPDFVSEEVRQWMLPVRKLVAGKYGAERIEIVQAYEREHGKRPQATLEQVGNHIEYLAEKVGRCRVGIGSDFYGVPITPIGLEDVSKFPHLLAEMIMRGWSDADVAGLASANFTRVFQAVEREGRRLRTRRGAAIGSLCDFDEVTSIPKVDSGLS
jgi:membrane dipeptidase